MRAKASHVETAIVPHLDAAFNLARWLMRDDGAARDAVQSACVRAITYFASLRGSDAKNWFLGIVRNVCYTALHERSTVWQGRSDDLADEGLFGEIGATAPSGPLELLERRADRVRVNDTLGGLPTAFREVLILRDMEDLSYADIAAVLDVPVGTVMSRLARARSLFRERYRELDGGSTP